MKLRDEANGLAPRRNKGYDGTIGDASHQARASRHNPFRGVVTALDLTHDPKNGFDVHALVRELVKHPHPNLYYVISNGQGAYKKEGFKWRKYNGSNKHDHHAHIAVGWGSDAHPFDTLSQVDDPAPWGLDPDTVPFYENGSRKLYVTDPYLFGTDVQFVQKKLYACGLDPTGTGGRYGPHTKAAVIELQKRVFHDQPKEWDGVVGPKTWTAILQAETIAQFIDRRWLKPRSSLFTGTQVMYLNEWYGLDPQWVLTLTGAETSMGRPEDALSNVYNFGCIKYNPASAQKPWAKDSVGTVEVPPGSGRIWWAYPDAMTGLASLGRLLKINYLDLLRKGGVPAIAPIYYGKNVPDYDKYLANVKNIEAAVAESFKAYMEGTA